MIRGRVSFASPRLYGLAGVVLLIASSDASRAQRSGSTREELSLQQEVTQRLKSQPIGGHTLECLNVPEEFLNRVADRIIRMDYQKRFRSVAPEPAAATAAATAMPEPASNRIPRRTTSFYIAATTAALLAIGVVAWKRLRRRGRPS